MEMLRFVRRPIECESQESFHTLIAFHDGENETEGFFCVGTRGYGIPGNEMTKV